MTFEQMEKIVNLAGAVALEAAWHQNAYTTHVKVPWDLITKLRVELAAAGVPWREMKLKIDKEMRENLERRERARQSGVRKRAIGQRGVK
jgi:hypothetical protein